jgi:peptidoglycan/LPS O-acetylase OafA/YrhL
VLVAGPMVTTLPLAAYLSDGGTWVYLAKTVGLVTANAPLPGVFEQNYVASIVNLPLWTLKYEAMCYLGLALLGVTGLIRSRLLTTVVLAAVLMAWVAVAAMPEALPVGGTLLSFLRLAFSFGLGTLAYVWRDKLPLHWVGLVATLALAALATATPLQHPAQQLFVAYAALYAAGLPLGRLASFSRKNDLSYGVYIYDWVIAQMLVALVPGLSQPALLAATLAIILPLAALSWFLIEKPMLGLKRSHPAAPATGVRERLARFTRSRPATAG